jgi:hypothetical protein
MSTLLNEGMHDVLDVVMYDYLLTFKETRN